MSTPAVSRISESTTSIVRPHPLHSITDGEITKASAIIRKLVEETDIANGNQSKLRFKSISQHDPPKSVLLPYLDAEAAGVPVSQRPFVPRCMDLIWTINNERDVFESTVSLDSGTVIAQSKTLPGQHSSLDRDEVRGAATKILSDPMVLEAIKKLNLPADVVVQADTWMYGADKFSNIDTHKMLQVLLYARAPENHPDSNQYSFPLPISPAFDIFEDKVIRIDDLATGGTEDGLAYNTAGEYPMAHCEKNEYYPSLQTDPPRKDLKPLNVVQPEGPSFAVSDGNCISWQKWRFRVGFNYREGMTIHDVRYDGRPVFIASKPLTSGTLVPAYLQTTSAWDVTVNHRTQNAAVVRARNLVVQNILTVGNYEYVFAWMFMQSGTVELETRATGILSTALIDPGKTSPWGTVVSPGVLAQNHQHLFCLRVDPMLDGPSNSIVYEDSVAIPQTPHSNPHGNAWRVQKTHFEKSGFADASPFTNRCFKIINEAVRNKVSGNPVGYKLVPQPCQLILAGQDSVARRRAKFAEHHVWVTRYRDGDLWAGGKWPNQSLVETEGVTDYAARGENVRNDDVVLWHTFGMTHNPRVEDFPVMPSEIITLSLKPADFFEKNPALDVPMSTQAFNKSTLVEDPFPAVAVKVEEGVATADSSSCCEGSDKTGIAKSKL